MWNEIDYPFPNLNNAAVEVWKWISNLTQHLIMDDYLSMLGLKLSTCSLWYTQHLILVMAQDHVP